MFYFFILPCVGFLIWAAIKLGGAMMEDQKPQGAFERIELLKHARNSGDRWQAAYGLSQEIHRMMRDHELEKLPPAKTVELYHELTDLMSKNATDDRLKRYMLLMLGQMGDPLGLPALETGLHDKDPEIQFFAAWGYIDILGKRPETRTPERLKVVQGWLNASDPALQKIASAFLVQQKNPALIADVKKLLKSDNVEVRWNTAVALASVGDRDSIPMLKQMFDINKLRELNIHTSKDLAQLVAAGFQAAQKLGDPEVIALAEKLKSDSNANTPEGRAIHAAIR